MRMSGAGVRGIEVRVASWEPEERVRIPAARQSWHEMTFVHHGYRPDDLAALLPDGYEPDTFDGLAWVGITPFWMHASVVPVLPGPRIWVPEVNVRTYVRDAQGRDAIWFLSLELDQAVVASALRTGLRLPYRRSAIGITAHGSQRIYTVDRRRPHRPGSLRLTVEIADELEPGRRSAFDTFLVGRWRAATTLGAIPLHVPVEHPTWPLHRARLLALDDQLSTGLGLPEPVTGPHVLFSPGVDVRLGAPRPTT